MSQLRGNVRLSTLEKEHISRYMQFSDNLDLIDTMRWLPFSVGEEERFLQTVQVVTLPYCGNGQPIIFSIISTEEDKPVGFVCLKGMNESNSSIELGIAIMEKEYRNHGLGTEALNLAINYVFKRLGLLKVGLTVFPSNVRAIKAYEKAGFRTKELLEKSWLMPTGEYVDMLFMQVTRD